METLQSKGDYYLNKYECGYYAVEKINRSIGKTLLFTKNYDEAIKCFNDL
ncbi:hypothetical protein [Pelosinus sp. UFO1]|nr:hypothetical protein [Pelosinus sp. UFO1]AIF52018.1 hypothetical protein UFO1_2471 [Pelosinus sp. UFO1]